MKRRALLLNCVWMAACNKLPDTDYQPSLGDRSSASLPQYSVGIHPLHNPQRLMQVYGPLLEYINRQLPQAQLVLEASRNYEEFERKLYAGQFAFAMPNPYQTVQCLKHGYRVFGKMGDDSDFRGIILVRKDSGIREVKDLVGRTVAYPAPTALAAALMPQLYLHTHGIDVNRDVKNLYVGSQESSIMSVYRGQVGASATWPVPWKAFVVEHPSMAAELEVKWQTATLPNNGWVVRQDVPGPIASQFAKVLLNLHTHATGQGLLQRLPVSRFEGATAASYRPVQEFLDRFSKEVRPLALQN